MLSWKAMAPLRRAGQIAFHITLRPRTGTHRPTRHADVVIGGPARTRGDPGVGYCLTPPQIDNGQVSVIPRGDAPLGCDAEDTRRPGAGEINKTLERKPTGINASPA